jgi:hypothetical protein
MYRYSLEERVFIVKAYWIACSIKNCQRRFVEQFGGRNPLSKRCIQLVVKKLILSYLFVLPASFLRIPKTHNRTSLKVWMQMYCTFVLFVNQHFPGLPRVERTVQWPTGQRANFMNWLKHYWVQGRKRKDVKHWYKCLSFFIKESVTHFQRTRYLELCCFGLATRSALILCNSAMGEHFTMHTFELVHQLEITMDKYHTNSVYPYTVCAYFLPHYSSQSWIDLSHVLDTNSYDWCSHHFRLKW